MKKSELFAAIAGEMKTLGFRRRKSNYEYLLDLGPGIEGWCSFADSNQGNRSVLRIATFVGVRSQEIEDRIAAWCGDVVPGWDGRFYVPTVSANVGYFTSQAQWLEHCVDLAGESIEDGIRSNVSDVTKIGLDFMRSHASYEGLIAALKVDKGQLLDRRIERLPLAFALAGDIKGAHRELEDMRRRIDDQSLLAVRYIRFIEGFESEFPLS
ncbi:hypothetical protein ACX27O_26850 [Micromonospora sp. SD19]